MTGRRCIWLPRDKLISLRACHAVIDRCREHGHISIIKDPAIARLTAALLTCDDWRNLCKEHPDLSHRVRLCPFATD